MDIVVAVIAAVVLAQFIDGRVVFAFALVGVVGRRALLHRRRLTELRKLGLPPEDLKAVSGALQKGDRDAANTRIAAVQERYRAELRARGIDTSVMTPEVGREIQWTDIVRHVFRVLDFDRAGTIIGPGNSAKAASSLGAYGYLLVESPILNQPVRLPIVHRDDFLLAASVFD